MHMRVFVVVRVWCCVIWMRARAAIQVCRDAVISLGIHIDRMKSLLLVVVVIVVVVVVVTVVIFIVSAPW